MCYLVAPLPLPSYIINSSYDPILNSDEFNMSIIGLLFSGLPVKMLKILSVSL